MSEQMVCTSSMGDGVATAAWDAMKRRHEQMMNRIKDPASVEPIATTTYAAQAAAAAAPAATDNPKDAVAGERLPLDLWPPSATAMACIAMLNGAMKYGRANWRQLPVRATVYVAAAQRHLAAWIDGEEEDEEGVPHLSSVLASLAILVDAMAAEKLIDDRPTPGGYRRLANQLTPHVARLRQLHTKAAE